MECKDGAYKPLENRRDNGEVMKEVLKGVVSFVGICFAEMEVRWKRMVVRCFYEMLLL